MNDPRGILEEFSAHTCNRTQDVLAAGLTVCLAPGGDREHALAWQRQYEAWKRKTSPEYRAKKNEHRRKMRALDPNYGR